MAASAISSAGIAGIIRNLILILVGVIGIVMARQNSKAGRGDHRGAVRLGIFAGAASLLGWLLSAHHVASGAESALLGEAIADAVLRAVLLWGLYLALEPWVRRYWPQTLITWTRVLGGRFRDPMVGRDLLFAVLFGLAYCALIIAFEALDKEPSGDFTLLNLLGGRMVAYGTLTHVFQALISGPEFFLLIFLLRVVLRRQWLAAVAFVALWTSLQLTQSGGNLWVRAAFFALIYTLLVVILLRFGLFALVVTVFLIDWINQALLTTDLGSWYGLSSMFVLLVVGAMTAFGFWTSLGSRKMIDDAALAR
jgi:hypothetical protein